MTPTDYEKITPQIAARIGPALQAAAELERLGSVIRTDHARRLVNDAARSADQLLAAARAAMQEFVSGAGAESTVIASYAKLNASARYDGQRVREALAIEERGDHP